MNSLGQHTNSTRKGVAFAASRYRNVGYNSTGEPSRGTGGEMDAGAAEARRANERVERVSQFTSTNRFSTKFLSAWNRRNYEYNIVWHNLDYYRLRCYDYCHRWYDSMKGRQASRDPIGEEGGRNLYGMLRNAVIALLFNMFRQTILDRMNSRISGLASTILRKVWQPATEVPRCPGDPGNLQMKNIRIISRILLIGSLLFMIEACRNLIGSLWPYAPPIRALVVIKILAIINLILTMFEVGCAWIPRFRAVKDQVMITLCWIELLSGFAAMLLALFLLNIKFH